MRCLILLSCLFIPLLADAQDPAPATYTPRFALGVEIGGPMVRMFIPVSADRRLDWMCGYSYREQRSWRFGHSWFRQQSEHDWQTRADSMITEYHTRHQHVHHQISLGHQWDITRGKVRPFIGMDALFGYKRWDDAGDTYNIRIDTVGTIDQWRQDAILETGASRQHFATIGAGGAVGISWLAHPHLMLQFRVSAGYVHGISIDGEPVPQFIVREDLPSTGVGTGLFVLFRF